MGQLLAETETGTTTSKHPRWLVLQLFRAGCNPAGTLELGPPRIHGLYLCLWMRGALARGETGYRTRFPGRKAPHTRESSHPPPTEETGM